MVKSGAVDATSLRSLLKCFLAQSLQGGATWSILIFYMSARSYIMIRTLNDLPFTLVVKQIEVHRPDF